MTDLLIEYDKTFLKIEDKINTIFKKITLLSEKENYANKQKLEDEVKLLITEQEKILKQMEFEIISLVDQRNYKLFNNKKIGYYKMLKSNKINYHVFEDKKKKKESKTENISYRRELENEEININYLGNLKSQETRRILATTEDFGSQIMVNMDEQTNKMKDINTKVNNMNNELDESNNILNKMKSKFNKVLGYFFE